MKADTIADDRGEDASLAEPLLLGESFRRRPELTDLALVLAQKTAAFRGSLHPIIMTSLADLVRSMNCYYSNLIEGHDTHPLDIERALREDYSRDVRKRDLQLEARAHIEVQRWIDDGGLPAKDAFTVNGMLEIHRRFGAALPADLLHVENPDTKERVPVAPGEIRNRFVRVGRHVPVSPGAVRRFLDRFEHVYAKLGPAESILAAAAAHHRFVWIHPFLDGNGRVARLMSHAHFLGLLDTRAVWSIARGLARTVQRYKELLANCDQQRLSDYDGRGNLSEQALGDFTEYFLSTAIDQVDFMHGLMQPDRLRTRLLMWAEEEGRNGKLPPRAGALLEMILYRGELPRGDAELVLGTGDRQSRRVVSALLSSGALRSESPRAPLRLAFPISLASRWLPGLFPEHTGV